MTTVIKPKRSTVASSIPTSGQLEIGELAINIADGKLFTKNSSSAVIELGGAGSINLQQITNTGSVTTNNIILNGANLIFEGLIENAFETTLTVSEPTEDRIISLPNVTGTVITTGNLEFPTNLNLLTSANIVFEGSLDDNFETTLTVENPTADRSISLPNESGVLALKNEDALRFAIAFGN